MFLTSTYGNERSFRGKNILPMAFIEKTETFAFFPSKNLINSWERKNEEKVETSRDSLIKILQFSDSQVVERTEGVQIK